MKTPSSPLKKKTQRSYLLKGNPLPPAIPFSLGHIIQNTENIVSLKLTSTPYLPLSR
ncbi:hypothetical protein Hdeb2414_s0012g00395161 [Helianthus debilis subsp. tardiflorus]